MPQVTKVNTTNIQNPELVNISHSSCLCGNCPWQVLTNDLTTRIHHSQHQTSGGAPFIHTSAVPEPRPRLCPPAPVPRIVDPSPGRPRERVFFFLTTNIPDCGVHSNSRRPRRETRAKSLPTCQLGFIFPPYQSIQFGRYLAPPNSQFYSQPPPWRITRSWRKLERVRCCCDLFTLPLIVCYSHECIFPLHLQCLLFFPVLFSVHPL